MSDFFKHGSRWVRADFHLHTPADKEFLFLDAETRSFKKDFIERLSHEAIHLGIITNHNKFDLNEFKSLRKEANKRSIFLLPGVELSVNDGAKGIHCLIVFDYESWIQSSEDFINQFLTSAFEGISNRENENTRCNYNLLQTLSKLEEHRKKGRDSFIVLAHVHDSSGFLKELEGGRVADFAQRTQFKETVLGFQKFRNYQDEEKVRQWFNGKNLALLEGSDCKCLENVGKAHQQNGHEKKCYLKLGAFTFEAVKFALAHHEERVRGHLPATQDLFISEIEIERSKGPAIKIPLNPDLNTLIGVRGSGKSSLLETIRFGLGLEAEQASSVYKDEVVKRFLRAGNRLLLHLADASGNLRYSIRREWGGRPNVLDAGGQQLEGLSPLRLLPTAYYGQKDIEKLGENFNAHYVENHLLQEHLAALKEQEAELVQEIHQVFNQLQKTGDLQNQKVQTEEQIAQLEWEIESFESSGLQALVAKELNFADDGTKIEQIGDELREMSKRLLEIVDSYGWQSYLNYGPKEAGNVPFFETEAFPLIQELVEVAGQIRTKFSESASENSSLIDRWKHIQHKFDQLRESLQEEFRKAKQRIDNPNLDVEAHKRNKQKLNREKVKLSTIEAKLTETQKLEQKLTELLDDLEALRGKMFETINTEIEKLNGLKLSFRIEVTYQGDKEKFKDWLVQNTKRLQEKKHAKPIAKRYDNPIQIYRDLYKDNSGLASILSGGSLLSRFRESVKDNPGFLTFRVPDKYEFLYNSKKLEHYSIGQKSTALISFVLSDERKKLFIIDQPEDDLDNHTVAMEIIGRISQLKPTTQFIFATHNPNILVLGDTEQVVICEYHQNSEQPEFKQGSIDSPKIQQTAINIMEGGQEAFDRRKNVYQLWKH